MNRSGLKEPRFEPMHSKVVPTAQQSQRRIKCNVVVPLCSVSMPPPASSLAPYVQIHTKVGPKSGNSRPCPSRCRALARPACDARANRLSSADTSFVRSLSPLRLLPTQADNGAIRFLVLQTNARIKVTVHLHHLSKRAAGSTIPHKRREEAGSKCKVVAAAQLAQCRRTTPSRKCARQDQ